VVARSAIPAGSIIDKPEKHFKVVRYVKGDEPKGGLTDLNKLKGQFLTRLLAEDQPIKQTDLIWLPKGLRAYSFNVEVDAVAGFNLPGSRVDIVADMEQPDGKEAIAKVILEDRLLLAVDFRKKEQLLTVTLAVTPEQAKKLALAGQRAKLRVLLRLQKDQVDKEEKLR